MADTGPVADAWLLSAAAAEGRRRRRRAEVRLSGELVEEICRRLRAGETLQELAGTPGMPSRTSVYRWMADSRQIAERVEAARRAGALTERRFARLSAQNRCAEAGERSTFSWDVADEILERMGEGESLVAICKDPAMPAFSSVYRWRRAFPDFAEQFRIARDTQAEQVADLSWEASQAVTPETAYATHVKLTHMRWTAGVLAPQRYRARMAEPEKPPEPPVEYYLRHFKVEEREDGAYRVVAFRLIPETNSIERETPEPPWNPPLEGRWRASLAQRRVLATPPVRGPEDEQWL